mmetsp:Transcript_54195/g.107611  ORF Transcript_54195/g.107611 Transcript_54195/m.107611 type:complete len:223 (+) Transcript_54195:289-957(+)
MHPPRPPSTFGLRHQAGPQATRRRGKRRTAPRPAAQARPREASFWARSPGGTPPLAKTLPTSTTTSALVLLLLLLLYPERRQTHWQQQQQQTQRKGLPEGWIGRLGRLHPSDLGGLGGGGEGRRGRLRGFQRGGDPSPNPLAVQPVAVAAVAAVALAVVAAAVALLPGMLSRVLSRRARGSAVGPLGAALGRGARARTGTAAWAATHSRRGSPKTPRGVERT